MIPEFIKSINPFSKNGKITKETKTSIPGLTERGAKIDWIEQEFNAALDFTKEDIDRAANSWKLYSGLNDGQWDSEVVSKLRSEGRNPFQANFVRSKVNGLAGSLVKNFFDIGFEVLEDGQIEGVRALKKIMYSDKELLDWNFHYQLLVVGGLVQRGVLEMYVDTKYSPLGNIGLRYVQPEHLILDPLWISDCSNDLRRAWKVGYFTPDELKKKWKHKTEEIENAILMNRYSSTDFDLGDINNDGFAHKDLNERYGDTYRVIEYHHIETEEQTVRLAVSDGSALPNKDEDLQEFAIINGIDLSQGIIENKVQSQVYYVTTICPELSGDMLLEDRQGILQIGRLPFFPWSSSRINGKDSGIPELLKSVQQTYNKRESMLDHMFATSANGALLIDPDIVDGDEARMEKLQRNWNNPSYKDWAAPGSIASGRNFFATLPNSKIDFAVISEINRMIDTSDRISGQPAASDGRVESSDESGILFARKQLQAEITQALLFKSLEHFWNEVGEGYFYAAKRLYEGVYRSFVTPSTGETIEVNKPIQTDVGEVKLNDISAISRAKVIVTQSPEGISQKAVDRATNIEFLRVIGPENPLARATAIHNVMKTLTHSTVEKAEFEKAAQIEKELIMQRTVTELMDLQTKQVQMQMMLRQMQQPQAPMGPEGAPMGPEDMQQPQEKPSAPAGNPMATMQGSNAQIAQS